MNQMMSMAAQAACSVAQRGSLVREIATLRRALGFAIVVSGFAVIGVQALQHVVGG